MESNVKIIITNNIKDWQDKVEMLDSFKRRCFRERVLNNDVNDLTKEKVIVDNGKKTRRYF